MSYVDGIMNMYEMIKRQYLHGDINDVDIARYVREKIISQNEAELIMKLKESDRKDGQ